jgi:hypothetical protein
MGPGHLIPPSHMSTKSFTTNKEIGKYFYDLVIRWNCFQAVEVEGWPCPIPQSGGTSAIFQAVIFVVFEGLCMC